MSLSIIATAVSGMTAAGRRLEAAASNIANLSTTGRPPGPDGATTAYRPVDVRQSAAPGGGVSADIVPRAPAFDILADPSDPNADAEGRVAAPAVDLASEVTDVLRARIDYAASVKLVKVADRMMRETLDTLA